MTFRRAFAALCLWLPLAAHAGAPDKFQEGVEAYRSGNYAAALAAFLEAQPSGSSAANLQFNLGLTYYRLHRYDDARAAFERLRTHPGYESIADYHLGLVAARLGDADRAATLWQPLASSAPEQALRDRASVALRRLAGTRAPQIYLSAAAGYDTDPALLDDRTLPAGAESATLDLLGTVEKALSHDDDRDVVGSAGGYWRRYSADNGLDQAGLFGGLARQTGTERRDRSLALDAGTGTLDGAHFLDTVGAGYSDAPRRGRGGAAFSAQLLRIQAAADFGYLQGWRARAGVDWVAQDSPRPWRLAYLLEVNDRADLASGGEFFSHSPIRNGVRLTVPGSVGAGWSVLWSAHYRHSFYRDPDVFAEGGAQRTERRIEQLFQAGARLRRPFARRTFLSLEYEYSRNASTIGAFDYDRHLVQIGVEWFNPAD